MKEKNGEHPWGDAGQIILGLLFIGLWVADSFIFRFSVFLSETVPFYVRIIYAVLLGIAAIVLFFSGHIVVREKVRPVRVIKTGIFRHLRHPLYLSSIFLYLGLTVFSLSLISFGFWMMIFLFYNYIANYEERIMIRKFGSEYKEYRKQAGKWLPRQLQPESNPPTQPGG